MLSECGSKSLGDPIQGVQEATNVLTIIPIALHLLATVHCARGFVVGVDTITVHQWNVRQEMRAATFPLKDLPLCSHLSLPVFFPDCTEAH